MKYFQNEKIKNFLSSFKFNTVTAAYQHHNLKYSLVPTSSFTILTKKYS